MSDTPIIDAAFQKALTTTPLQVSARLLIVVEAARELEKKYNTLLAQNRLPKILEIDE